MNKKQLTNKIVGLVGVATADNMRAFLTDFAQQKPYTMIHLLVTVGKHDIYNAYGFSKVSWPDTYDAAEGERIAIRKAAKRIAGQILSK